MNLEIYWKKHPTDKKTIIGICKELPDNFCYFYIQQVDYNRYWIMLPSMNSNNLALRLFLRDANTAREFCVDFLNNTPKIDFGASN